MITTFTNSASSRFVPNVLPDSAAFQTIVLFEPTERTEGSAVSLSIPSIVAVNPFSDCTLKFASS